MKLLEMNLQAYGPFTEFTLDFTSGHHGVHFIYGPNEAGKSSALRALRDLLYGIPQRSPDNFLHSYAKMRIGAKISSQNGETLTFLRRKGRSNTLRQPDDKCVIEDTALAHFLKHVDAELFATLFGIDHAELTKGGAEIIAGGGNLGKMLFAAGSGIADLGLVQKELQEQAEALYKRSAQKPIINTVLAQLDANKKALRDAQLPGRKWQEHDQALETALRRLKEVDRDLLDSNRQLHHLERVEASLPLIARRKELLENFKTVAGTTVLPPDFSQKRQTLATNLKVAASSHEMGLQRIENLNQEIASLTEPQEILAAAEEIDHAYRELGSLQKADKDRIQLKTRHSTLMAEAGEILSKLRPGLGMEQVERLRLKIADMVRIQDLGAEYERLTTRSRGIAEEQLRLEQSAAENRAQIERLTPPWDTAFLKNALEEAEPHGADEAYCRKEQAQLEMALKNIKTGIAKLGLWSGPPDEMESLPVPSMESIAIFGTRMDALQRREAELQAKRRDLSEHSQAIMQQIETLQAERRVPAPVELDGLRRERDAGWLLVRRILEGSACDKETISRYVENFPPAVSLTEAFEIAIQKADQLADRLRDEADNVAVLARLVVEKKRIAALIKEVEGEHAGVVSELATVSYDWRKLWAETGLTPLSPQEMRTWLQRQNVLAEKISTLREARAKTAQMEARVRRHCEILDNCLREVGESVTLASDSLSARIRQSRRLIERQETLRLVCERHKAEEMRLGAELATIRSRAGQVESELLQWKVQWGGAMQLLGLDETALPRQAGAVVEDVKKLFDTLKEAHILSQRIEGIGRDEAAFNDRMKRLVSQVAPDLDRMSTLQAVPILNQRLARARTLQDRRKSYLQALAKEHASISRTTEKIAAIEAQLELLCQQAGCGDHQELPAVEERSAERTRMEAEISTVEADLRKLSAGAGIDVFVEETLQVDPDGIAGKIRALQENIAVLEQEKESLNRTIGSERNELEKMDGSARAADLAEEIELQLGSLQSEVERYAQFKIAAVILNQAIERFREKNQGPILTRASGIFSRLTCGAFGGLRADYNEKGDPILVGVRPETHEVIGVDGMSTGTADQLYLSLRLAALLDYLERNDPMPLIVDDILIQFDDERAAAALEILGELASKTQVILFSHHRHLLEVARGALSDDVLIVHQI